MGNPPSARKMPKSPRPESALADWRWYASGRLRGVSLLRERQVVVLWDESHTIYLLDLMGRPRAQWRAPKEIVAVAGADNGRRVVAAGRFGQVWWLGPDLTLERESQALAGTAGLAIDPWGEYALASGEQGKNVLLAATGKRVSVFDTPRPLRKICFALQTGEIIAAAEDGLIASYDFKGNAHWKRDSFANIGSLAIDARAEIILAACFSHGVLRLSGEGRRVGSYQFDGSPSVVDLDAAARRILVGTLERELVALSIDGALTDRRSLPDKPIGLAVDALGRYAILGFEGGEVWAVPIPAFFSRKESAARVGPSGAAAGPIVEPAPTWEKRVTETEEETDTIVIAPTPSSDALAIFGADRRIHIIGSDGEERHATPAAAGVGRSLVSGDRWLAGASDRAIVAYDPVGNTSVRVEGTLFEVSHLELFERFGEMLIVESCEFVTRRLPREEPRWRKRMPYRVDSSAVGAESRTALTLDDQSLVILDGDGAVIGKYRPKPAEPVQVKPFAEGWITTGREMNSLRRHDPEGALVWSMTLPFAPWTFRPMGEQILITSAEGHSALVDEEGELVAHNAEPRESARYFLRRDGSIARAFVSGKTLLVTDFAGSLRWRHADDHKIGPYAVTAEGLWVFLGRLLTYFPLPD